jgi:hypothetical protein
MDPVVNTDLVDSLQLFKTYLDGKMIQLLLTLFRTLFSSLTGEISLLGLRINLSPVGKLCVSMKVMILHQIQRMKKGYVQRKTGPLLRRIKVYRAASTVGKLQITFMLSEHYLKTK